MVSLSYAAARDAWALGGLQAGPPILGARAVKKTADYLLPGTLWHLVEARKTYRGQLEEDASVADWLARNQSLIDVAAAEDAPIDHPQAHRLYPYQRAGVAFARHTKRCLLADEPGLGKTVQAIIATDLPTVRRRLIVCPTYLKDSWERHLRDWSSQAHWVAALSREGALKRGAQLFDVSQRLQDALTGADQPGVTLIVGWEQLRLIKDWLALQEWDALVVDEAHRAKDRKSQQTKVLVNVASQPEYVIMMTGTPTVLDAADVWSLAHTLHPKRYPSYWHFFAAHVHAADNYHGGKTILGNKNARLLKAELAPFTIRRYKKNVLPQLPAKVEETLWLPMVTEQARAYKQMAKEMIAQFPDTEVLAALGSVQYIRCEQLAFGTGMLSTEVDASNKLDALLEILDDEAPHKVIIGCLYRRAVELVLARIARHRPAVECVSIMGGMSRGEVVQAEGRFVHDARPRVLVATIQAVQEGFTFVSQVEGIRSDLVLLLGVPRTEKMYLQFSDRLHRIGQKDTVRVKTLLSRGTVEEAALTTLGFRGAMNRELFAHLGESSEQVSA